MASSRTAPTVETLAADLCIRRADLAGYEGIECGAKHRAELAVAHTAAELHAAIVERLGAIASEMPRTSEPAAVRAWLVRLDRALVECPEGADELAAGLGEMVREAEGLLPAAPAAEVLSEMRAAVESGCPLAAAIRRVEGKGSPTTMARANRALYAALRARGTHQLAAWGASVTLLERVQLLDDAIRAATREAA